MLLKFSLFTDDYAVNTPSVHINPDHVVSVEEWKSRQVSTVRLVTGEKHNVVDYGDVAKVISEAKVGSK